MDLITDLLSFGFYCCYDAKLLFMMQATTSSHLHTLGVMVNVITYGRIIKRWIFRKWYVGVWTVLSWLRIGTVRGLL